MDYSVHKDPNFIEAKDFLYSLNEIEIEDDASGIYDEPDEHNYLSWRQVMIFSKAANYECITCN